MLKTLRRWWKYLGAKLGLEFDERADPRVQLEQAITEARDQHRRLTEQAATVIANQKTTEMQLDGKLEELTKLNANARQAVLMADEATKKGDATKAAEYASAAESFANRLIALEAEVESLKQMALQAAQASDQAKSAVSQNSTALQKKLADKQRLLSQLDQAKMQESLNATLTSLSQTIGEDVPSMEEVRAKIEQRYAKASATAELSGSSVEAKMLEVEHAAMNTEAQARLEQIRSELGIAGAAAPAEVSATADESSEAAPQQQASAPEPPPAG